MLVLMPRKPRCWRWGLGKGFWDERIVGFGKGVEEDVCFCARGGGAMDDGSLARWGVLDFDF
jgi:hypothetical protein